MINEENISVTALISKRLQSEIHKEMFNMEEERLKHEKCRKSEKAMT